MIDGDGTILMRKSCGGSRSEISGGITEVGGSIGGIQSSKPLQSVETQKKVAIIIIILIIVIIITMMMR